MTKDELIEILDKLRIWREQRLIPNEYYAINLTTLLLEKLLEFKKSQHIYERVHAIGEMLIYVLNSLEISKINVNDIINININNIVNTKYLLMLIYNNINNNSEMVINMNIIASLINYIVSLNRNAYKVLNELINELNTKTGYYNRTTKQIVWEPGVYIHPQIQRITEIPTYNKVEEDEFYYYLKNNCETIAKYKKWSKANLYECTLPLGVGSLTDNDLMIKSN